MAMMSSPNPNRRGWCGGSHAERSSKLHCKAVIRAVPENCLSLTPSPVLVFLLCFNLVSLPPTPGSLSPGCSVRSALSQEPQSRFLPAQMPTRLTPSPVLWPAWAHTAQVPAPPRPRAVRGAGLGTGA